jgi:glycosyltransferase involved in cell wall biosynthesis
MAGELRRTSGVESLTLLANRATYERHKAQLPDSLRSLPLRHVPGPEGLMRRMQLATRLVPLDRWADGADWIYCPKEQPVGVRRARLAVTVHDLLSCEPPVQGLQITLSLRTRLLWRMTMARVLARAHLIATVSRFTRNRLVELFDLGDRRRIVVIGNGVDEIFQRAADPADEHMLNQLGVQPRRYLLAVGGLNYRKGGDVLLEIGHLMHREGSAMPILVCGASHDPPLVAQQRERQQDADFPVRLCEYLSDDALACLYRHCAAMLFPSRYEGFGIPLAEAMAAGAPVVCSDLLSLRETAADAAVLVSSTEARSWVDAVDGLCRSEPLRQDLIARGRARAAEHSWSRCARRLVDAMQQV